MPETAAYSSQEVDFMLSRPFSTDFLMRSSSSKQKMIDALRNTIEDPNRARVAVEPSKKIYQGGWYYQIPDGICGAQALATCLLVAGITPDSALMTNLLNSSFFEGSNYKGIKKLQDLTGIRNFLFFRPLERLIPEDPFYNARVIKGALDLGVALFVGVNGAFYFKRDEVGHALCVAGYEVTPQQFMNVQVIDSNLGSVMVSLEHFSRSVNYPETYAVSKPELFASPTSR